MAGMLSAVNDDDGSDDDREHKFCIPKKIIIKISGHIFAVTRSLRTQPSH